jgi:dolichyl-diphosphooligosaccharide--protein glycosyltransferase
MDDVSPLSPQLTVRIIKQLSNLTRRDETQMKLPKILSKESLVGGLKNIGKLRIKISHDSILTLSILLLILFIAFTIRILPLRWEIETGAMHLSEFDPYYQYSLTNYMVQHGLISPYWPTQWRDYQRWYPSGINMGSSLSSLPLTAAVFYDIVSALGVNIDLMSFCSIVPTVLGMLAVLILYFLGKDIGGKTVGMLAALFLALNPSFIQRTSLGFFDTETVGVFSLLLFSFLFLRAIEEERPIGSAVKYSIGSAGALAYFIMGWGAAYYLVGLTTLFVFVLLLLKRYTQRLLLVFSLTFGLGISISMVNPDISTSYLTSYAVLPVAGLFVLLCLSEILRNLTALRNKLLFVATFLTVLASSFTAIWALGYMHSIAGKFLSVLDPFIREGTPLVESVAEHRISSWGSIYYDLGVGILFFVLGLYFVARNPNNKNLFLLLFGLTTLYFASSMVRLLIILAPAFGLLAAVGIVGMLKPFVTMLRESPRMTTKRKFHLEHVGKEYSGVAVFLIFLILMTSFAISPQSGGIPKVIKQAYAPVTITAGSLPIAPERPVKEWFDVLKYLNDFQDSHIVVSSWWDYGYWLSILGNVTSLADNATINSTSIENIGFTFMANETQALKMLKSYNAKYVLVFTTAEYSAGNWVGYGDEGKWMWMAKISGQAEQRFIDSGLLDANSSWVDEKTFGKYDNTTNKWAWNDFGKNSTIYKLMWYAKHQWITNWLSGSDPDAGEAPTYFKQAYFAGVDLSPDDARSYYGGLVPLVCLYEIDWATYDSSSH